MSPSPRAWLLMMAVATQGSPEPAGQSVIRIENLFDMKRLLHKSSDTLPFSVCLFYDGAGSDQSDWFEVLAERFRPKKKVQGFAMGGRYPLTLAYLPQVSNGAW